MKRIVCCIVIAFASACGAEGSDSGEVAQQEALALAQQGALLLDVRSSEEFASGHVPGASNIPYDELGMRLAEIESRRDDPVVVYCEKGPRASKAAATLEGAGFSSVRSLEGHMSAWRAAGLPVQR